MSFPKVAKGDGLQLPSNPKVVEKALNKTYRESLKVTFPGNVNKKTENSKKGKGKQTVIKKKTERPKTKNEGENKKSKGIKKQHTINIVTMSMATENFLNSLPLYPHKTDLRPNFDPRDRDLYKKGARRFT
jgi:hypothetical protein